MENRDESLEENGVGFLVGLVETGETWIISLIGMDSTVLSLRSMIGELVGENEQNLRLLTNGNVMTVHTLNELDSTNTSYREARLEDHCVEDRDTIYVFRICPVHDLLESERHEYTPNTPPNCNCTNRSCRMQPLSRFPQNGETQWPYRTGFPQITLSSGHHIHTPQRRLQPQRMPTEPASPMDGMLKMLGDPNSGLSRSLENIVTPEFLTDALESNPAMKNFLDKNPEIRHILRDPETMRENIRVMTDPAYMSEFIRNNDRAMANLNTIPGAEGQLSRMLGSLEDPFNEMEMGFGENSANRSPRETNQNSHSMDYLSTTLPNPWDPSSENTRNINSNRQRNNINYIYNNQHNSSNIYNNNNISNNNRRNIQNSPRNRPPLFGNRNSGGNVNTFRDIDRLNRLADLVRNTEMGNRILNGNHGVEGADNRSNGAPNMNGADILSRVYTNNLREVAMGDGLPPPHSPQEPPRSSWSVLNRPGSGTVRPPISSNNGNNNISNNSNNNNNNLQEKHEDQNYLDPSNSPSHSSTPPSTFNSFNISTQSNVLGNLSNQQVCKNLRSENISTEHNLRENINSENNIGENINSESFSSKSINTNDIGRNILNPNILSTNKLTTNILNNNRINHSSTLDRRVGSEVLDNICNEGDRYVRGEAAQVENVDGNRGSRTGDAGIGKGEGEDNENSGNSENSNGLTCDIVNNDIVSSSGTSDTHDRSVGVTGIFDKLFGKSQTNSSNMPGKKSSNISVSELSEDRRKREKCEDPAQEVEEQAETNWQEQIDNVWAAREADVSFNSYVHPHFRRENDAFQIHPESERAQAGNPFFRIISSFMGTDLESDDLDIHPSMRDLHHHVLDAINTMTRGDRTHNNQTPNVHPSQIIRVFSHTEEGPQNAQSEASNSTAQDYDRQLEQLTSMGFQDNDRNLAALRACSGDVNQAIEFLLRN